MHHRERRVALELGARHQVRRVEERIGERGGAGEELGALLGGRGREQRLEELTDDPEGEVALVLAGARGEDAQPAADVGARLGEQPCLADPGGALDRSHAAVAAACRVCERAERRQLDLALEQEQFRELGCRRHQGAIVERGMGYG